MTPFAPAQVCTATRRSTPATRRPASTAVCARGLRAPGSIATAREATPANTARTWTSVPSPPVPVGSAPRRSMASLVSSGFSVFVPICGVVGECEVYSLCTLLWRRWLVWGLQSSYPSVASLVSLGFTVCTILWHRWWVWGLQSLYPWMTLFVSLGFTVFVPLYDIIGEFGIYSLCRCLSALPWHH